MRRASPRRESEEREFAQEIIAVDRVTRVMAGGKRMRFRACVAVGAPQGNRVGVGVAKGSDVTGAVNKAVAQAKKTFVTVPIVNDTIPYPVRVKFKGAEILLKPAPRGTGVKAGGSVRTILKLARINNVVSKMLGSSNKIANVKATMAALQRLQLIPLPRFARENVPSATVPEGSSAGIDSASP